ncbi:MAG: MiaB/RimO family radical SAM methylthiotransferase [bacterium]|nr:MiaB/RimO family radical SAM methylthiotransferase [bacterium]
MIHIRNFGCRVNQAEIDEIVRELSSVGYEISENEGDVLIVNTCAVTQAAEATSRRFIRNSKAKLVIATGCYATKEPEKVKNLREGVVVYTNDQKNKIISEFEVIKKNKPIRLRSRVFLKIQDGCKANCSYCIIPRLRPYLWYMDAYDVIKKIKTFVEEGYKEIVLCGIRLGSYYDKKNRITLTDLLELIEKIVGDFRIRLSSIEPQAVSYKMIDIISSNPYRFAPFIHFAMQSLSDKILKSMNRPYTSKHLYEKIEYIRKRFNGLVSITSDIIVGYPLETYETFEYTYKKIEELELSGLHVFRYSPRPYTISYMYKSILPDRVVKEMSKRMNELSMKLKVKFANKHINVNQDVVKEDEKGMTATGLKVRIKPPKPDRFELVKFGVEGIELVEY